jgi:transcriptional regulator with XRE-family HTH domain
MSKETPEDRPFREIGNRLKAFRLTTGLSQKEFAEAAGIRDTTYNQYERGLSQPKVENARALRETYGLSLDWIYEGDTKAMPHHVILKLNQQKKELKKSQQRRLLPAAAE